MHLPETPGVYLMKGADGSILYIGKAANLKRRVSSYFLRPQDYRITRLVGEIRKIDYVKTDTALEALILESALIKKHQPPFNVREKDDKSFLYVEIAPGRFPRVLLARGRDPKRGKRFGPFADAGSLKEAMRILRRIFPWNVHKPEEVGMFKRPCFDAQIGLCPGTCIGTVSRPEYLKTIRNIRLLFAGKKSAIVKRLAEEMRAASRALEFEKAEALRRQIFALEHIRDIALITEDKIAEIAEGTAPRRVPRIEGYDISNISGTSATGSMVVFTGDRRELDQYRKFRIKTVEGANDVAMLGEVLDRRFKNDWPLPDLILVDGGVAQVNAARAVLKKSDLPIPVVGMVKGPERKRTDIVGTLSLKIAKRTLIRVRDEAHRFAIGYHKKLRRSAFFG
ncbi:MAG: GIY-YIG nuclease family protein [bacterium]|nr:GIY-YIG nuclease family protein [bacterium]